MEVNLIHGGEERRIGADHDRIRRPNVAQEPDEAST